MELLAQLFQIGISKPAKTHSSIHLAVGERLGLGDGEPLPPSVFSTLFIVDDSLMELRQGSIYTGESNSATS
jgi:hypothetical protein